MIQFAEFWAAMHFQVDQILKICHDLANSSPDNKNLAEKLTLRHLKPYGAADPLSPIEKAESRANSLELFKYPDSSENRQNKEGNKQTVYYRFHDNSRYKHIR